MSGTRACWRAARGKRHRRVADEYELIQDSRGFTLKGRGGRITLIEFRS